MCVCVYKCMCVCVVLRRCGYVYAAGGTNPRLIRVANSIYQAAPGKQIWNSYKAFKKRRLKWFNFNWH